jgi:hypothetical protein
VAALGTALKDYSTTAGSNGPSGSDAPSTIDDSIRNAASVIRNRLGTHGTIASAATCDIGTKEERSLAVTGTTGITSFGTSLGSGGYGIVYELTFDGALTITHSSSLDCIGAASITTEAGDSCALRYSSAGWKMLWYARKSWGAPSLSGNNGKFLTVSGGALAWAAASVGLSGIIAASTSASINNSTYAITWEWAGLTGSNFAFKYKFGSGTNTGDGLVIQGPDSGQTGFPATLLNVKGINGAELFRLYPSSFALGGTNASSGTAVASSITGSSSTTSSTGVGGALTIAAGDGGASGTGGDVTISGGGGGTKGSAVIRDGSTNHKVTCSPSSGVTAESSTGNVKLKAPVVIIDSPRLQADNSAGAPTIGAGGGAGASIVGSDCAFQVSIGTGSPTSVTVNFAGSHSTQAAVLVSGSQSGANLSYSLTATAITISSSAALVAGNTVSCFIVECV